MPTKNPATRVVLNPDPATVWAPLPGTASRHGKSTTVHQLIREADPEVPMWVAEMADRFGNLSAWDKRVWVEAVRWFRLTEYAPKMAQIAEQPQRYFEGRELIWARSPLYQALAALRSPDQIDLMWRGVNDESLDLTARSELAASLMAMGDNRGRVFLEETYAQYLKEFFGRSKPSSAVRSVLERIHDPVLMARIESLPDRMYSSGPTLDRNISTLIRTMEINGWTTESLMEIVNSEQPISGYDRYDAVQALGERGGLAELAILDRYLDDTDFPSPPGDVKLETYERSRLAIRYRFWQSLAGETPPQVQSR